jgi:hypothetical protein
MVDIFDNIFNNKYSSESELLLKKCIDCNFHSKEFITCGKTDDFGHTLEKKCCQEKFCTEHLGNNEVKCSYKNCNSTVNVCNECYPIKNHDKYYYGNGSEYTDLFCSYCDELFCNYHMKDGYCRNHAYYDRD